MNGEDRTKYEMYAISVCDPEHWQHVDWSSLMAHLWHPPRYSWPTTGKFALNVGAPQL